jgi:hypothetical protein
VLSSGAGAGIPAGGTGSNTLRGRGIPGAANEVDDSGFSVVEAVRYVISCRHLKFIREGGDRKKSVRRLFARRDDKPGSDILFQIISTPSFASEISSRTTSWHANGSAAVARTRSSCHSIMTS